MVTIMELILETGLTETERYGEEVLNAGWLPQAALMFGLVPGQPHTSSTRGSLEDDVEGFLKRLYLAQE